jgi:hypothetical protein
MLLANPEAKRFGLLFPHHPAWKLLIGVPFLIQKPIRQQHRLVHAPFYKYQQPPPGPWAS